MVPNNIPERAHWYLQDVGIVKLIKLLCLRILSVLVNLFERAVLVLRLHSLKSLSLLAVKILPLFEVEEVKCISILILHFEKVHNLVSWVLPLFLLLHVDVAGSLQVATYGSFHLLVLSPCSEAL